MARVTVMHSRVGSKSVRVYAEIPTDNADDHLTGPVTKDGKVRTDPEGTADDPTDDVFVTLTPLGTYYKATQTLLTDDLTTEPVDEGEGSLEDQLDHGDVVTVGPTTKGQDVFSYVVPADDNDTPDNLDDDTPAITRYVVRTSTTENADGNITAAVYQHVDITALAAPDIARDVLDANEGAPHEQVQVKASIPMAVKYDHIHFGVWAALGDPDKETGLQKLTDLGIGFVQSISEDGVTERLGIGTATYNGDWVAVIQRRNSTAEGAFNLRDGAATMTADFDKDEFEADLDGLATLEGTLDGNGFSGMTAKGIKHADLDSSGEFEGEFSGNIYGEKGTEAAGVFDFAGGEAGSFRGAFGGSNQK